MLKTVLKILAIYCLIAIAVSGCALIGEYAEGITATPNGTAHTEPSTDGEAEGKQSKSISISEDGKVKQTKGEFDIQEESESKPIKVSNITDQASQEVKPIYKKVDTLYMLVPCDTLQRAFEELRKRRKFYIIKNKKCNRKCCAIFGGAKWCMIGQ